jgi:hypothetical protein
MSLLYVWKIHTNIRITSILSIEKTVVFLNKLLNSKNELFIRESVALSLIRQ